jgi:hypothetical protein
LNTPPPVPPPERSALAVLPAIVTFARVVVPVKFSNPPPSPSLAFPNSVLFSMYRALSGATEKIPPPFLA